MSDRVAGFDKGIVQQLDTVDHLYEAPCNEFVTNYIGNSNRLRGTIEETQGDFSPSVSPTARACLGSTSRAPRPAHPRSRASGPSA